MFDAISDSTIRNLPRQDHSNAVDSKDLHQQKAEKLREERPVEEANESIKARDKKKEEDKEAKEISTKYKLERNQIIYEKYDKYGELIYSIPPAVNPVDELA